MYWNLGERGNNLKRKNVSTVQRNTEVETDKKSLFVRKHKKKKVEMKE